MPALGASFPDLLEALHDRYGKPDSLAAGLGPFEALIATLLDRLIDSKKAHVALNALRDDGLLEAHAMAESDLSEVTESLRSAGVKIPDKSLAPLIRFGRWVVDRHHGSVEELAEVSTSQLRQELLELNGIGAATADALLLFGLHQAAYPVDRATYRILVRHGWLEPSADYEEARNMVESQAPDDADTLSQLAAWFERLGRDHCRASVAKCDRCPLAPFLPEGGAIDPSA